MICSWCQKKEKEEEGKDLKMFASKRSNICLRCMSIVRQEVIAVKGIKA